MCDCNMIKNNDDVFECNCCGNLESNIALYVCDRCGVKLCYDCYADVKHWCSQSIGWNSAG